MSLFVCSFGERVIPDSVIPLRKPSESVLFNFHLLKGPTSRTELPNPAPLDFSSFKRIKRILLILAEETQELEPKFFFQQRSADQNAFYSSMFVGFPLWGHPQLLNFLRRASKFLSMP